MLRGFKKVRCLHCGHIFMAADIEDNATAESMPVHCPKCGQKISLNRFWNLFKRLFGSAVLVTILLSSCSRYEDQHWDRMLKARQEIQQQDCLALLQELVDASSGNLAAVTRMTTISPQVINRLLEGIPIPTKVTEIAVRAVAEDFYFYKKRFWLLDLTQDWKWRKPQYWLMNLPYVADPFLNYPDYRAEQLHVRDDGLKKDGR